MFACQLALACTQTAFVLGAVYFKYSANHDGVVHSINPVVFAFIREVIAGTIMCTLAYLTTRARPKREDLHKLAFLGLLMYFNQLFFILGVEMSGVVVATCIQPVIPVFTAGLAMSLGKEEPSLYKTMGILLASAGSICMADVFPFVGFGVWHQVAGGAEGEVHGNSSASQMLLGNILLFFMAIAMALYYIFAKPLLQEYPPMAVAAWAYVMAACIMGFTATWYNQRYQHGWYLPRFAMGPLIYWILVCSVCGYYIIAWATKHLPSSQVAAFQCLQPPIGTVLGFMILGEALTVWDFGALGVIFGLFLVNRDPKPTNKQTALATLPKIEVLKMVS